MPGVAARVRAVSAGRARGRDGWRSTRALLGAPGLQAGMGTVKLGSPHRARRSVSRRLRRAGAVDTASRRRRLFAVTLYRDTGVVLRVQKLGEADRIVTLLTRRHGKVRAVAKGVRRTRSRWGARLEPFNHVDVQCYTGRSAGRRHPGADRRRVRRRHRRRLPPLHRGLRGAGDRGPAGRRGGRAGAAGVPAGRRRDPGAGRPRARRVAGARRLPAARDDARRLGPGDHRLRPLRRSRARTARSASRAGERCARGAGRRARSPRPRRPSGSSTPCCTATGRWRTRPTSPTRRETSGLVAAHLQWHLERQLRSLPLVERRATPAAGESGRPTAPPSKSHSPSSPDRVPR